MMPNLTGPLRRPRCRASAILALLFLWLSLCGPAWSQPLPRTQRPKIGLALSGGSALGIAHIGVLEWFEAHHIPIDFIAGTSMGGLVGGCYAMGMSPDAMRQMLLGIDWNTALAPTPPFETLTFRRKEDARQTPSRFGVGLRHGVALPAGLSPAHPVGLLLSRISLPYSEIPNFDALPTPFRCVAVDIGSGQAVILSSGSIATALRATMAIPGAFTPVVRDGRMLVDGGLLNNTPTEAVKAMGADIVIAVDLSSGFTDQRPGESIVGILTRSVGVSIFANERRSLGLADLVVAPDLAGLTSADFAKVDAFRERGLAAAAAKAPQLEKWALTDPEWEAYRSAREARILRSVPVPRFVAAEGVSSASAAGLARRLKDVVGVPLSVEGLERRLTALTGIGRFESFQYGFARRDGQTGLQLYPGERRDGPPFVRFGLTINGADPDNIQTDFVARLVGLDVGQTGTEVRGDLRLGSNRAVALEVYRPLDRSQRWFVAPRVQYREGTIELFTQGDRFAIFGDRSKGVGIDLGYTASPRSEVRFGWIDNDDRASVRTGDPSFPALIGATRALRAQWIVDRQDSPMIPSKGTRLRLAGHWYFTAPGTPTAFPTAELTVSHFSPLGRNATVFTGFGAGSTFGRPAGPIQQFTVGGPLRLGAYGVDEFRGNDYLIVTAGYLQQLLRLPPFLGDRVMGGLWAETGGAFAKFGVGDYHASATLGVLAETLAGPMAFGYSFGDQGRSSITFSIGRAF